MIQITIGHWLTLLSIYANIFALRWQGKEKIKCKVAVGAAVRLFNIILIIGKIVS